MTRNPVETTGETSLLKVLGNWDVLALGFGAMIGFGWVVLTGDWIGSAGSLGAVLAMVAGGAIMAVVGLTYAELTAAMPKAGGEHNFLLRGHGPPVVVRRLVGHRRRLRDHRGVRGGGSPQNRPLPLSRPQRWSSAPSPAARQTTWHRSSPAARQVSSPCSSWCRSCSSGSTSSRSPRRK